MQTTFAAHALLDNIVVLARNTSHMHHKIVERLRGNGVRIEYDWLNSMGLARFGQIADQ